MTLDGFLGGSALWGSLIMLGLIGCAYFLWINRSSRTDFELQRKSRLLTAPERNFFECLANALTGDFYIFTKVRVMDVIEPSPNAGLMESLSLRRRLTSECLDYVLCKKDDLSIFGVVELENFEKRSNAKDRARREKLISEVCKTANLRLFYFDIRQDYQGMDIRRLITGRSRKVEQVMKSKTHAEVSEEHHSLSEYSKNKTCPKCHSEIVTKVAVKGKRIGEKFMMCRKYPYCDYQVSVKDTKVLNMQRRGDQPTKKAGFSDWSAG